MQVPSNDSSKPEAKWSSWPCLNVSQNVERKKVRCDLHGLNLDPFDIVSFSVSQKRRAPKTWNIFDSNNVVDFRRVRSFPSQTIPGGGRSPPPPPPHRPFNPLTPPPPPPPLQFLGGGEVTTPPPPPTPSPAFIVIHPTLYLSNSYSVSTTAFSNFLLYSYLSFILFSSYAWVPSLHLSIFLLLSIRQLSSSNLPHSPLSVSFAPTLFLFHFFPITSKIKSTHKNAMGGRRCALPPNPPPVFFIRYPALYLSNSYSDTSLPYLPGGGGGRWLPPPCGGGGHHPPPAGAWGGGGGWWPPPPKTC